MHMVWATDLYGRTVKRKTTDLFAALLDGDEELGRLVVLSRRRSESRSECPLRSPFVADFELDLKRRVLHNTVTQFCCKMPLIRVNLHRQVRIGRIVKVRIHGLRVSTNEIIHALEKR